VYFSCDFLWGETVNESGKPQEESFCKIIQSDAEGPGPVKRPATWSSRQGATASLKRSDTPISNQRQVPYLPIHVYANIGDEDNLISVKQFAMRAEAKAWMDQQKKERPGYYEIIHESEFDCSA